MRENIPMELRQLPHWVVAGDDKVPLNPRTGWRASPTDPNTWATFEEAIRTGMKHIGFVLTEWDPFTIIDLDNKPEKPCTAEQWARHQKILEAFQSYTERSASGTGYHIIVKGKVPAGMHRDNVEVYSSSRYMICTGDVVRNLPITDFQPLLDILYSEMGPVEVVELVDHIGPLTDEELVEMAMGAVNGDKFSELCQGDWQAMGYPSQSEADLALLSILAFYTMDNDQVRRIFRLSGLGRREKAQKNNRYLDFALTKIRAKQPMNVEMSALTEKAAEIVGAHGGAHLPSPTVPQPAPLPSGGPQQNNEVAREVSKPDLPVLPGVTLPPGLIGEIAQYIYQSSVRPVPEISLVAAIALVAGVCARSYNISGSGLNQYLILLARTGAGKEGAATGIDSLMAAARPQIPMVNQFMGPAAFASGQALIKVLDERPCFVSVLGEFGITLQQICSPNASSAEQMLKKVLLDLFNKSGWVKILQSSAYSDKEKNTKVVQAPNVTILGESTPETFFDGLDATHILQGLIPRFTVIEYTGPRVPRNRNTGVPPNPALVNRFAELVAVSLTTSNNHTCATVQMDQRATSMMDAYDQLADKIINESGNAVESELWNRAHVKALKLAALIAVGVNPHNPIITAEIAEWAIDFINRDVDGMTTRFKAGDIGVGDHRHENDVRRAVELYLRMNESQRLQYKTPKSIVDKPVVPYHYLRRKLRLLAAFKNDRRGAAKALEDCLRDMTKADILALVPPMQARTQFNIGSELYVVGQSW